MRQQIPTLCGMCSVRCPVLCQVEDGRVNWIEGHPDFQCGALCGKGSAGISMVYDEDRPKGPMIRQGARGSGQWKRVGWDEALDHAADGLRRVMERYGRRSVMLSCRGGPFQDLPKTFIKALGSPNFTNHDAACGINVHHASRSVYGVKRKGFVYDIANAKHLILVGRNLLESIQVKEARAVMEARSRGLKLTYVDVRETVTASKASRFWMVRPGSDLALLQGLAHEILETGAYDKEFADRWITGLDALRESVAETTPEWAEKHCGVEATQIRELVAELAVDRPKVIFHPGWMYARYRNSFAVSRMLHVLNALMGNVEVEGGQIFAKGASDVGQPKLRTLVDQVPAVHDRRADGVGWRYKHFDDGPGLYQLFMPAMLRADPYPIRAYVIYRHDPLVCFPDRGAQLTAFEKLEFILSIDAKFGETTWFADVVLPNSSYLEKASPIVQKSGTRPYLTRRQKVIEPVYDSKPEWWIFRELARRLGIGSAFPYESIEELWSYQLQDTDFSASDFDELGYIPLSMEPLWHDRDELPFKTESGKIELRSSTLEEAELPSFESYEPPPSPGPNRYRLIIGRHAIHTHGQTQNNPHLHEIMPTNDLWLHCDEAEKLGVQSGDEVEVITDGGERFWMPLRATRNISPEAVFLHHGFGRSVPLLQRAFGSGVADQRLCYGGLDRYDPAGGGLALQEAFVTVRKPTNNGGRR